jgi:phospholipase/carboxylesterase
MGYYEGRAWFPIDTEALERALREGVERDMGAVIPSELDSVLERLERMIQELSTTHSKIIVGGFSQGAMLASHLAMRPSLSLDGLVLLSGSLLALARFPSIAQSIPFYQSHGTRDPILPLSGAKRLEEKLLSLHLKGKLRVFEGGHEIPHSVINEVKDFLAQFVK